MKVDIEMKKIFLGLMVAYLSACAAGSNFKPVTLEGAQCKAHCADNMSSCRGSSYSCDRASSTCMNACQELDDLASKKK
jgi:hypothetical protein